MPRRSRRRSKRRGPEYEDVLSMFICGNGVRAQLDGEPVHENAFLARAAWNAYRTDVWRLWIEWGERRPPGRPGL